MEELIPSWFKIPQIDSYDGKTDPLDHLESYKSLLMIQDTFDALLCIALLAILRKVAWI